MKLIELYKKAVEFGIKEDPRSAREIKHHFEEEEKKFKKLEPEAKKDYDPDRLFNPFADTRILHGAPGVQVKNIMVGIDVETPELLLADRLRDKGKKIDCLIGHHPEGRAYANFYRVMELQADVLSKFGISISVAEAYLEKRMKDVAHRVKPVNHFRAVDAAELLEVPLICIHTPADNHVARFLQNMFDRDKPYQLRDVIELLKTIPEYRLAASRGEGGPAVISGSPEKRAGRIMVDMTGGTEGAVEMMEKLPASGVSTVVGMHLSEKHLEAAQKSKLNVVIAGHISSDSLGLNLLLDKIEKSFHPLNITDCSGFTRVKRN
ncbi:MAG TPA: NGG1p interacting factor NIF3 [bacterium]|nr:NGG1p interacting factor NIF3 [bacterium]